MCGRIEGISVEVKKYKRCAVVEVCWCGGVVVGSLCSIVLTLELFNGMFRFTMHFC